MKGKEEKPIQGCVVELSHRCGQLQLSPAKDPLKCPVKCLQIVHPGAAVTLQPLFYWSRVTLWDINYLPPRFVRVSNVGVPRSSCGQVGVESERPEVPLR